MNEYQEKRDYYYKLGKVVMVLDLLLEYAKTDEDDPEKEQLESTIERLNYLKDLAMSQRREVITMMES
jgi:hypothetical protein